MPGAPLFPNPERRWERAASLVAVERDEVERRIGSTGAPCELLGGGQANLNVRVGDDRVLRIYRRDPASRAKEQRLLGHAWRTFVTPAVRASGDDFLVLDYVAHGPLLATPRHGAAVGRTLAEIHRPRFSTSGLLACRADGESAVSGASPIGLDVVSPFGDIADTFRAHARSALARAAWLGDPLRSAVDDILAAHAEALRREARSPVLLHGDFKASNLHWAPDDRLVVLDWEFAYAGPALMDIGQLLRWSPPASFIEAFADSYCGHGGSLPPDWRQTAAIFDLVNLASLAAGAAPASRRGGDLTDRLRRTVRAAPTAR